MGPSMARVSQQHLRRPPHKPTSLRRHPAQPPAAAPTCILPPHLLRRQGRQGVPLVGAAWRRRRAAARRGGAVGAALSAAAGGCCCAGRRSAGLPAGRAAAAARQAAGGLSFLLGRCPLAALAAGGGRGQLGFHLAQPAAGQKPTRGPISELGRVEEYNRGDLLFPLPKAHMAPNSLPRAYRGCPGTAQDIPGRELGWRSALDCRQGWGPCRANRGLGRQGREQCGREWGCRAAQVFRWCAGMRPEEVAPPTRTGLPGGRDQLTSLHPPIPAPLVLGVQGPLLAHRSRSLHSS